MVYFEDFIADSSCDMKYLGQSRLFERKIMIAYFCVIETQTDTHILSAHDKFAWKWKLRSVYSFFILLNSLEPPRKKTCFIQIWITKHGLTNEMQSHQEIYMQKNSFLAQFHCSMLSPTFTKFHFPIFSLHSGISTAVERDS